jgi:hypothetical protein
MTSFYYPEKSSNRLPAGAVEISTWTDEFSEKKAPNPQVGGINQGASTSYVYVVDRSLPGRFD